MGPPKYDYKVAAAIVDDPQILFATDPLDKPTILGPYKGELIGLAFGLGGPLFCNWARKRPLYSAIHVTIASSVLSVFIGRDLRKRLTKYYDDRDMIFRHYIQLHPELFPPKPRVKIADKLEDWYPIR